MVTQSDPFAMQKRQGQWEVNLAPLSQCLFCWKRYPQQLCRAAKKTQHETLLRCTNTSQRCKEARRGLVMVEWPTWEGSFE